jgi:hypothetical protein
VVLSLRCKSQDPSLPTLGWWICSNPIPLLSDVLTQTVLNDLFFKNTPR